MTSASSSAVDDGEAEPQTLGMTAPLPFVVLKFGGTSVTGADRWRTIGAQARSRLDEGLLPVLVCSALSGVTNALEALIRSTGEGGFDAHLAAIRERHQSFADDMGIEAAEVIEPLLEDLGRLALGASLVGEASPRVRARILSAGELLSTKLGAAWLQREGLRTAWQDARHCLITEDNDQEASSYLSARCSDDVDQALEARFRALAVDVIVTQGFIAARPDGATAVLGRGGSDTSAAYFAARLDAKRCEIWTDVPGIYTANPRDVPSARLLRRLDYDEAQEIATCGAKVLHPRCLLPARRRQIPIEIRCTSRPEIVGTRIGRAERTGGARVKAVSAKHGVTLISMDTLGMWQQVGFLADVFSAFQRHGVSVDLVSTSESNVTASIDESQITEGALERLDADLSKICRTQIIRACAAVSLVGRDIRTIMHRLGPALELFEEHRIHLISQAASDLNLTFVVDEAQAGRLVHRLHALLFGAEGAHDPLLGAPYSETFKDPASGAERTEPDGPGPSGSPTPPPWWLDKRPRLIACAASGTPRYVYDRATLQARARSLLALKPVDRVFYAMKANPQAEILRALHDEGVGFECVSVGELNHLRKVLGDVDPARILFTPNFASPAEYGEAFAREVHVTIDNLEIFEQAPDIFQGQSVSLRLDPGQGKGHHAHVRTAGPQSKFGIAPDQWEAAAEETQRLNVEVIGLHAHAGSGIRTAETWKETALFLLSARERFPKVRTLDLGGGLGVVERPGQRELDLAEVAKLLAEFKTAHPGIELWLEPGRFLVAECGVLLAHVTQTKSKGDVRYVGLDAGMHSLIRPALYGAYHEVVNLTRYGDDPAWVANVVGPICETGDTLGYARTLPVCQPNDVMLIATAGAYGMAMASDYNLRGRPHEEMI